MNLRATVTYVTGAVVLVASMSLVSYAQISGSGQANSASHVAAEMTKGKLNPAESKPGDTVAVKLKDDVRSNGEVVLKKGTVINGVVRNVKRAETKGEAKGQAQSMMEVEWLAPAAQGRAVQSLSIALQSVTQVNPLYQHEQNNSFGDDFGLASSASGSSTVSRPARTGGGGGLLGSAGGAVGATAGIATSTTSAVGATAGGVASAAGGVTSSSSSTASGRSNVALLSMPSVVAVDQQTSSTIESTLGTSSSGQLFRVGHGELVSAGGSKQSVDIYSHLSNDTVITSPGKNFEISSGAQMQMLVGVNRK